MDVIVHAVNADGFDSLVAADSGHVGPKTWLDFCCDHPATILGAENDVDVDSGECVGHVPPLRGSHCTYQDPPLTGWAQ